MDFIFQIAILIMSVVIHEVSHGYAARMLGDHTAEYQGRLTLNPLKHLDFVGSFIVPALAYQFGGFLFGWAKPVPYNPYNLKPGRWSEAKVAFAGPASNIAVAVIFGLILRVMVYEGGLNFAGPAFIDIVSVIVLINIVLAIFNLVPIPPLDGSKIPFAIFPDKLSYLRSFFERYGMMLVILFIFFLWQYIFPIVISIFQLITGIAI